MNARIRPANAGAVTRTLVAAGFRRGEEHKAARGVVRGGWSTFTEGITSTQDMTPKRRRVLAGRYADGSPREVWENTNTPTGYVHVDYQFGSHNRLDQADRNAKIADVLGRAAEVLRTKGFEVETTANEFSGQPYLIVCRKDADGNVVTF